MNDLTKVLDAATLLLAALEHDIKNGTSNYDEKIVLSMSRLKQSIIDAEAQTNRDLNKLLAQIQGSTYN